MKLAAFILILVALVTSCAPRLPKVPSLRDKSHIYIQPATWQEQGRMELYGRMDWLIVAGVVAVAASMVVSMAFNKKIGAACLLGSAALIGGAMFVKGASPIIPWAIGACILLYLGPIAWKIIVERRGTRELVATGDYLLSQIPDDKKPKVLETISSSGDGGIQSPSTEVLVTKAKAEILVDAAKQEAEALKRKDSLPATVP